MNIDPNTSHIVYVNSAFRSSGIDSDFTFNIQFPEDKRYNKVVMLDALIPKSYYLIQPGGNTFQLSEPGKPTVTLSMPIGNYTYIAFQIVTGQVLTSGSPNGWTYTTSTPNIFSSADTGKFTWTVSGNGSNQPTISFINNPINLLFQNFGFNAGSSNKFVSNTLTSVNVPKLQVEDHLFINSDLVQGSNNQFGTIQEISGGPNPPFSTIVYQCTSPDHYSKYLNSPTNSTYHFLLCDEFGNNLNLNGLQLQFTLLFYKENDIFERFKEFMKMATIKMIGN